MYKKICLFIFMFLLLPMSVLAKNKIELNANKTDLTIGDEIVITAKVTEELDSYAIIATLKYDENVFQKIEETNFDLRNASSISYNEYNNKFGIVNRTGTVTEGENLFSIRLKVKNNATVGNTNIALTNISSSNGSNKISIPSSVVKVLITKDATSEDTINNNEENIITEDNENIISTFTTTPIIWVIGAVAIILLIVILVCSRKTKLTKKVIITFILSEIVLIGIIIGLILTNGSKKDVNDDGIRDYDDVEEIIKYLIDIKGSDEKEEEEEESTDDTENVENNKSQSTSENKNKNKKPNKGNTNTGNNNEKPKEDYDTNNDGKVDIEDAGHVADEVNKNTKVLLTEAKLENEYYVDKGDIILKFKAEITPADVRIKQIKINNQYYDVTFSNDVYSVTINDINKSGKIDFNVTEVVLDNGKNVNVNLKVTKEVLKDVPYVNKFNLDDENKGMSFNIVDEEDTFISGTVNIYDNDNKIYSHGVDKNTKLENLPLEEEKTYRFEILVTYDLDSNKNDTNNHFNNELVFNRSFVLGGNYNFELTNISITDALFSRYKPIISFTSTNTKKSLVTSASVTVDDGVSKSYEITKRMGDNYEVTLTDADTTPGKHTINLDSVRLETLKSFENEKDFKSQTLTYTILKDAPKVEDFVLNDNRTSSQIEASFRLNDETKATTRLMIALIDSENKTASSKEITKEELDISSDNLFNVVLPYDYSTDGVYKVIVYADYELSDKYHYTNINIGEKDILSPKDIEIQEMYLINDKNVKVDSPYISKDNNTFPVAFKIVIGNGIKNYKAYGGISYVTINGLNCPISTIEAPNETRNYYLIKAFVKVPTDAGIYELKANRVQLSNNAYYRVWSDYFATNEKTLKIEVLKDKPRIENLKVTNEDYNNGKVTFDFDVVLDAKAIENDSSFANGTIELNGVSQEINRGKNSITFENVDKNKNFDLIFKATYDLDTDTLDTDKNNYNDIIHQVSYGLYDKETYKNVAVTNGVTNKQYYEKNENIKLNFAIEGIDSNLNITPKKVIIASKEYELKKVDTGYELNLDGYKTFGQKTITITGIVFDNGKSINLNNRYTFNVEVLKDILSVNDFSYSFVDSNIKLSFNLKDGDNSLVDKASVIVKDDKDNIVYNDEYKKEILIPKDDKVIRYFIEVRASFDRDIDQSADSANYNGNVLLLNEIISFDKNNIELKDIIDINLYHKDVINGEDVINKINEISLAELNKNLDSYFVEVAMDNMPSIRANIKSVIEEDNHLILILDYENVTKEGTYNNIRIDFGELRNGIATNEYHPENAIKVLLEKLEKNENVTLKQNYDFSKIDIDRNVYIENYSGTLDGNGFTFHNLSYPLFGTLTGKVQNLNINKVTFDGNGHGALANKTNGATITNVAIDNITRTSTGSGQNGGLIGEATNTKIEATKVTSVTLNAAWGEQQNGLFIGNSKNNTVVNNCYAEGKLLGGWNYTSGFIGNAQSTTMTNNYVKVSASGQSTTVIAFGDAWQDSNSVYENNICIANGTGTTMIGSNKSKTNNYFYVNSEASSSDGVTVITEAEINDELFKTRAHFDDTIWHFNNVSATNLPTFKYENKSVLGDISHTEYDSAKEVLYGNLKKLMPYYDANKIIETANSVTDYNLNSKDIKHIVPIDKTGNIVTYLTTDDIKKIAKIKVVFDDNTNIEYDVLFDKMYDMVVSYHIPSLKIDYNYSNYVIDANSQVVNNLTNYLKQLDYTNNLDILTTNNDSRIYRDFYNEVTSKELKEFVLKFLANSNYTNTNNENKINDFIEREVKKNQTIEKVLYVYNYFRRFYDVKIDNMNLYDFMLFNMDGFDSSLTPIGMTNLFFGDGTGANFNTAITSDIYANLLSKYTKLDTMTDFLKYMVTNFSKETDMANWVRSNFKGILVELPIDGEPDILYSLWDHFSHPDKSYPNGSRGYKVINFILPILTLPENAAYIISSPAQFIIGAQRTYIKNPFDPEENAFLREKISTYTTRMKSYYETAYAILQDKDLFNNIHLFHIDKRNTKDIYGVGMYNTPNSTEEPFHKNFNDVLNLWPAAAGVNAAAWGYYIEWQVAGVLDSTLSTDGTLDNGHVTYKTFTHESAHNLDGRLFLKANGRRYMGGGEDYADMFLMQSFEKFGLVMNFSINFNKDLPIGSNLTPERINSEEKVNDFYKKAFDVIYTIDYIEAQAFLQLTDEEQSKLAVQISYPNAEKNVEYKDTDGKTYSEYKGEDGLMHPVENLKYKDDEYALNVAYSTTQYTKLDQISNFEYNKLNTIYDLIDNKIMLYPGKEKISSQGPGSYGGEGYNVVHWYQPHNDYGFPNSYSFKWFAYEMLGYAGYSKGFVEYASNIHSEPRQFYTSMSATINKDTGKKALSNVNYKSDAMALKTITNGAYTDVDEYKKARFEEIENKLDHLNKIIDVKAYVQKFYDALKEDTKDIKLPKSSDVRHEIYNTLKNYTDDFRTNDIYMDTWQQDVSNLEVSK